MGARVALIGSVGSSRRILEGLVRHDADIAGVLGLAAAGAAGVSGYARLDDVAAAAGAPYAEFTRVNDGEVVAALQAWEPDVLFAVGLSQLVGTEVRATARVGSVGFHPTALPAGRGRAPVAWIILDRVPAAATFFELVDEADAGGILVQEPFAVADDAYAADVLAALDGAIDRALDRWLPSLLAGEWAPEPQDETLATWYGRRAPEDGLIDWHRPAADIARLVRASGEPHPGAFTHAGEHVLRVWRARPVTRPIRGVVGRIVDGSVADGLVVQTGDGLLLLERVELEPASDGTPPAARGASRLRVGARLGR